MRTDVYLHRDTEGQRLYKRIIDICRVVNGNVHVGNPQSGPDNLLGYWLDVVTPGVADTEFTVTHNLGFIPTGIIVFAVDKAAVIYASRKNQWTITQAFFKANLVTVSLQGLVT
jgi:hypothetical protein